MDDEEERYTRITLRLPKELHGRLTVEADRTSKSLNAEIVARLAQSFEPVVPPIDEKRIAALVDKVVGEKLTELIAAKSRG